MKKALNLIIIYFVFLILGIAFGTLLHTMYSNILNYVAGRDLQLFSVESLIESFVHISFCMLFLICPAVSFYRIRHPAGVSQGIAFIIMSFLTWAILIPANHNFCNYLTDNFLTSAPQKTYLSKDYFRHVDNEVYYFTDDFTYSEKGGMEADAVVISISRERSYVDYRPVRDTPSLKVNSAAAPFREVLVSQSFLNDTKSLFVNFEELVKKARRTIDAGFIRYIFYLSFGLALCSIYALTDLFDWKLLNSVLLFFLSAFVLGCNSGLLSPWLSSIEAGIDSNVVYSFLAHWTEEPLVFVGNCLLALLLLVLWIVTSIVKNHKRKKE
mgnify:CR=1 FL=1